ncbi:hypothetical protein SRHO_G00068820 [Serrasalmus rhombeus]
MAGGECVVLNLALTDSRSACKSPQTIVGMTEVSAREKDRGLPAHRIAPSLFLSPFLHLRPGLLYEGRKSELQRMRLVTVMNAGYYPQHLVMVGHCREEK